MGVKNVTNGRTDKAFLGVGCNHVSELGATLVCNRRGLVEVQSGEGKMLRWALIDVAFWWMCYDECGSWEPNLRPPVQVLKQPPPVKVDVLRGVDVVDHQGLVQPRLENHKSLHFMALVVTICDLCQTIITPFFVVVNIWIFSYLKYDTSKYLHQKIFKYIQISKYSSKKDMVAGEDFSIGSLLLSFLMVEGGGVLRMENL